MSTDLSSLFRLILVRGQTCSAVQQTRRLSDSELMAKTDDIVLQLKRKTKTDRSHTLKLLEKYFHDDEPFRNERGISMYHGLWHVAQRRRNYKIFKMVYI